MTPLALQEKHRRYESSGGTKLFANNGIIFIAI